MLTIVGYWNPFACRYHLLFTLTGAGKYNFLGTKRWLEENMDRAGMWNYFRCLFLH